MELIIFVQIYIIERIKKMEIITFVINNEKYVVVEMIGATHVMSERDWKRTYGQLHPERWKE